MQSVSMTFVCRWSELGDRINGERMFTHCPILQHILTTHCRKNLYQCTSSIHCCQGITKPRLMQFKAP